MDIDEAARVAESNLLPVKSGKVSEKNQLSPYEEPMDNCPVCSSPATQKCSACHTVAYCSREHQRSHWKTHRDVCRSWRVATNDVIGRHLIATRDIKGGEVVLREAPLVSGPPQLTGPVCLGECGKPITPPVYRSCTLCGWPLCGAEQCAKSEEHRPECEITQRRGQKISISSFVSPHPNYQCITVLRILYQRDHNKALWDKLMLLQSHCEERKGTEKYEADRVSVAQFIRRFFKLEDQFTEEEILRVCGILQVNGHEVPLTDPPSVAIYEQCSMLEHNCRPNCCKSFTDDGFLVVHAGRDIQAGEHLSICYTDSLWGTPNRRHYLAETKFFNCACERCADVTEFGTWFSAMKCQDKDCKGFVLPETFLVDPKTDSNQIWTCSVCSRTMTSNAVDTITERIGRDLEAMQKGDAASCQMFLNYYEKLLHPNHYYLTDVRLALAQLIGQNNADGLNSVSDEEVELKGKLCGKLIDLMEVLNPAEVRVRGTLLFEQHAAVAEAARRCALAGSGGPEALRARLAHARGLLAAAAQLLQHEPVALPEGQLCRHAHHNLLQVDRLLQQNHVDVL